MIFGIGVDLCEIARIQTIYEKYGDKFAHKMLTSSEFEQFVKRKHSHSYLASRFAAKEAVVKAFGTGFTQGISLQHIQITNNPAGQPKLEYTDAAAQFVAQQGIVKSFISITDERTHVAAFVVLEI